MANKIGIIGYGFLGQSMVHIFKLHADMKIYDKYKPGFDTLEDVIEHSDYIWVCLPTPMYADTGEIDLHIIDEALSQINALVEDRNNKIVIIKSTITPGTTDMFNEKYNKLNIIHNPEFLTARRNLLDAITPARIILGGHKRLTSKVAQLYQHRFGNAINMYQTSSRAAELTKYAANLFFMTKVVYANMIYGVCEKLGLDYNEIKDMMLADGRIANSHMDVPGHDGKFFAGGMCFPKDISAFIVAMKELGADVRLLETVQQMNLDGRPEKDWEQIPGVLSKR